MKKILLIICFIIVMLVTVVSAADFSFDNYKVYNKIGDYGKIAIWDSSIFGDDTKLVEYELLENSDTCFTECYAEGTITIIHEDMRLFDLIEFKDVRGRIKEKSYKLFLITYEDAQLEVDDYKQVCDGTYCYNQKIGSHLVDGKKKVLTEYNGEILAKGTYRWRLEGTKGWNEDIDWIPEINSFKFDEWIWWQGTAPVAYWKLNEDGSGSGNAIDTSETGKYNMSNNSIGISSVARPAGKLGNAVNFSSGGGEYLNTSSVSAHELILNNATFTIAFWFMSDVPNDVNYRMMLSSNNALLGVGEWYVGIKDGVIRSDFNPDSILGTAVVNDNAWHRLVITRDNSTEPVNFTLYIDNAVDDSTAGIGKYASSADWALGFDGTGGTEYTGLIDDVQFYHVAWSVGDVATDWNGGDGQEAEVTTSTIQVTLTSPTPNNTRINTTGHNFTATVDTTGVTVKNATTKIWLSTGEEYKSNFSVMSDNYTNVSFTGIAPNYTYLWNVYGCGENATDVLCNWSNSIYNITFDMNPIIILNETYIANTTEGNIANFELNLSINDGYSLAEGLLYYNNTNYNSTLSDLGSGNYSLFKSLTVPNVAATVNNTFYWKLSLTVDYQYNTTGNNQSVIALSLDDCSTNDVLVLNYSIKDEDDKSALDVDLYNTTIEITAEIFTVGTTNIIINFSQNYTEQSSAAVCIVAEALNNSNYEMDVIVRYDGDEYASEFNNIQNFSLSNETIPQNIDLLDLLDSRSTTFLITYKDGYFLPVGNALIDITRRYVQDGLFRTVEAPVTDSRGQTVGHFIESEGIYTIIVKKGGQVLATFENVMAKCQDAVIGQCEIDLNAYTTTTNPTNFETYENLDYTFRFNAVTRVITVVFTVQDGSTSTVDLNTTKYDMFGNVTVCSDTLTSSSGTLTCTIPESYGNITVISELYKDRELIASNWYSISPDIGDYFGGNEVIMILILVITLQLMFITSRIGIVIGAIMGMIIASVLVLYTNFSIIGTGSAMIWLVIAGGILIWRIAQRT